MHKIFIVVEYSVSDDTWPGLYMKNLIKAFSDYKEAEAFAAKLNETARPMQRGYGEPFLIEEVEFV